MKIVIKLPDKEYENIIKGRWIGNPLADYIEDGTPLPEGHGRLIDADAIAEEYKPDGNWDMHKILKNAKAVIEADREAAK